jgi:hypothetical protein
MMWRFALPMIFGAHAWACACSGNWPSVKQAWKDAPAVFLGTVTLADPDGDGRQTMFQDQFVRIRVEEAFKGVTAGETIELHGKPTIALRSSGLAGAQYFICTGERRRGAG